eukprot:m.20473 g.20473  ORF g.20473 m.20473 type:complete len:294 (+) comp5254_c0_seq1:66-947(+)
MTSLLDDLSSVFGDDDLYVVLGVEQDATLSQVKKKYYLLARKVHPDKARDDSDALRKFQLLSRVYAILSDEHRRKVYNETGSVEEDVFSTDPSFSWSNYWRELFPAVDDEQIISFADSYRESEEEMEAVKKAYLNHKGDMTKVFENVMLSNPLEDEDRFRKMIDEWIENEDVPTYSQYHDSASREKRKKKATEEAAQAKKARTKRDAMLKRMKHTKGGSSSNNDLAMAILQRGRNRKQHFDELEKKYSKGKSKHTVPSEDEFQEIQKRLDEAKATNKRAKVDPSKKKKQSSKK